jgi:dephospho-CoA kinase
VKRVLITGMSGTGKSSVIAALAARGYKAVDADDNGLSHVISVPEDELTGLGPGQDWVWQEDCIAELLAADDTDVLFLGGCAPNQGTFYPQFDHVILLSAPADVIVARLTERTTNPYGKRPEEIARTLALQQIIEPLLRQGADHEIDTTMALDEVVARVLQLVGLPT